MNKRMNVSVGMGGTLIITVFVVLCLMVFAVLSFTTAHSDLKLSNKSQEITVDYYSIHGKAEEKLSEICDVLYETSEDKIISNLLTIEGVSLINDENIIVQYEVLGEKNQKISVELNIMHNTKGYYYQITAWNLSNIVLPVYEDEIIDIWEGIE